MRGLTIGAAALLAASVLACGDNEPWTVQEDLRIPLDAADGEVAGAVLMDVDSHGRIHILRPQLGIVRVFSPDGELSHSYGEPGTGPGQIGPRTGRLMILPGDTVVIADLGVARIGRFSPDGEHLGERWVPHAEGLAMSWRKGADGHIIQEAAYPPPLHLLATHLPEARLLRRSARGEIVDTIADLPVVGLTSRLGLSDTVYAFPSATLWTVLNDGRVVYGVTSDFHLEMLDPEDSDQATVVQRRVRQPRWSDEARTEVRSALANNWISTQDMPREIAESRAAQLVFADRYPAFTDLVAGPDGTVWVRSALTVEEVEAQNGRVDLTGLVGERWDVFDGDGRHLGAVRLPRAFYPLVADGRHLYGVVLEDGNPRYALRMRLE